MQDGKVVAVNNGVVSMEDRMFNFSIHSYGNNGEKTYNLSGVPETINGYALVRSFVELVEKDIA